MAALVCCNHNYAETNCPPSTKYDHRATIRIKYNHHVRKVMYHRKDGKTEVYRGRVVETISDPVNPFCPDCKDVVTKDFAAIGLPSRDADKLLEILERRVIVDDKRPRCKGVKDHCDYEFSPKILGLVDEVHCHSRSELMELRNKWLESKARKEKVLRKAGLESEIIPMARRTRVARSVSERLERVKFSEGRNEECPVCHEGLMDKASVSLSCGHMFHRRCLLMHCIQAAPHCPVCEFEMPEEILL